MKCNYREVLLKNYVDKTIQGCLRPFTLTFTILFLKKFNLKDNFITSNSVKDNLVTVLSTTIIILSHTFISIQSIIFLLKFDQPFLDVLAIFDITFFFISLYGNSLAIFFTSDENVKLLLNIQEVYGLTKIIKKDRRNVCVWNWVYVLAILVFNGSFCLRALLNYETWSTFVTAFCFEINIVYAIGLIRLIRSELQVWVMLFKKCVWETFEDTEVVQPLTCERLLGGYVCILEAYRSYKKVVQTTMLCHTVGTFTNALIYAQQLIEISKNETFRVYLLMSFNRIVLFTAKDIVALSVMCLECEWFYEAAHEAQAASLRAIAFSQGESFKSFGKSEIQRLCKNVCRAHTAAFSKASGCGFFSVDAALPLGLVGAITTYTFVLLQFAFLN